MLPAVASIRALPLALIALAAGCSERLPLGAIATPSSEVDASDGSSNIAPADGSAGRCMPCNDFPADPIIGPGAPVNAPGLFGAADGSAPADPSPCLVEPQDGALFPNNWLRPRFRVKASGSGAQHLYEFRLHATTEAHDLLVYTTSPAWTMPKDMWLAVAGHVVDEPITMSVRSAQFDGEKLTTTPATGTIGTFTIAPVVAEGTLVYWTSSGNVLKGFTVGDESVGVVLQPSQTSGRCVGCHASTPDGLFIGHEVSDDPGFGVPARVELHSGDGKATPSPFLNDAARSLLARTDQLTPSFSRAHWQAGDRLVFSMYQDQIVWTDLESTSTAEGVGWGVLQRGGDPNLPFSFAVSHDGQRIAYASADVTRYGTQSEGAADLRVVPFNARAGGTSVPLEGGNDPSLSEYYPSFSPDDRFLAFARVPAGQTTYDDPLAEVEIIPSTGGSAIRLDANDPPACSDETSPGVTNSWPKWAPQEWTVGDKTYYWIIFSSRRAEAHVPQLYVAGVVVSGASVDTHAAIYLWNQPENEGNHTPSWDLLQIPPPPK
jgi:hypothetical protein